MTRDFNALPNPPAVTVVNSIGGSGLTNVSLANGQITIDDGVNTPFVTDLSNTQIIPDTALASSGLPVITDIISYASANNIANDLIIYVGDGDIQDPDYVWFVDTSGDITLVKKPSGAGSVITQFAITDGTNTETIDPSNPANDFISFDGDDFEIEPNNNVKLKCNANTEITDADLATAGDPILSDISSFVTTNTLKDTYIYYLGAGTTDKPEKLWYVDCAGNILDMTSTPSDTQEPTEEITGTVSNITETTADLTVQYDEDATLYFVVVPGADTAPTNTEVIAGQASGGGAPVDSGNQSITASTSETVNLDSMSDSTGYCVYFVAVDAAGNESMLASDCFTTLAPTPTLPLVITHNFLSTNGPWDSSGSTFSNYDGIVNDNTASTTDRSFEQFTYSGLSGYNTIIDGTDLYVSSNHLDGSDRDAYLSKYDTINNTQLFTIRFTDAFNYAGVPKMYVTTNNLFMLYGDSTRQFILKLSKVDGSIVDWTQYDNNNSHVYRTLETGTSLFIHSQRGYIASFNEDLTLNWSREIGNQSSTSMLRSSQGSFADSSNIYLTGFITDSSGRYVFHEIDSTDGSSKQYAITGNNSFFNILGGNSSHIFLSAGGVIYSFNRSTKSIDRNVTMSGTGVTSSGVAKLDGNTLVAFLGSRKMLIPWDGTSVIGTNGYSFTNNATNPSVIDSSADYSNISDTYIPNKPSLGATVSAFTGLTITKTSKNGTITSLY